MSAPASAPAPLRIVLQRRLRAGLAATAALALTLAAPAASATGIGVKLEANLSQSTLTANTKQITHLRVGLTGGEMTVTTSRAPMNVALVIDKSSSMTGDKIENAKQAAIAAVDALGPNDIVSVITYDSVVTVVVPATKVSDRHTILRGIRGLRPGGMTALFAGASKGAAEVRKFFDRERINRVILLSDGQANVGPSSPGQLAALGTSLRREGIAVTTVGLGLDYNEDLMAALAQRSGGKHIFVEHPSQLAQMFREGFDSLARIMAKEVVVKVTFADGFRPVRTLGFDAEIIGQTLTAHFAQLYGGEMEDFIVELETPRVPEATQQVATVEVSYHNVATRRADRQWATVAAMFSNDAALAAGSENPMVMVSVVERIANERNELAMSLRDKGQTAQAKQMLLDNDAFIRSKNTSLNSGRLDTMAVGNATDALNLDSGKWKRQRKVMKERSFDFSAQRGGQF